jgi:hypothetical protein
MQQFYVRSEHVDAVIAVLRAISSNPQDGMSILVASVAMMHKNFGNETSLEDAAESFKSALLTAEFITLDDIKGNA